jgi:hypothetical protein
MDNPAQLDRSHQGVALEDAMRHLKAFLSHLTVEARLADILRRHLDDDFLGLVDVFVSSDITSIPVGSQWHDTLIAALQTSEMHLILCSPESIERPWIQYEAGAAGVRRVPTIPLCHSGLRRHQLPVPISEAQGIQLNEADGLRALYTAIASRLTCAIPTADFDAFAAEVVGFEEQYQAEVRHSHALSGQMPEDSVIDGTPEVVCVTSPQFQELGFHNQIEMVQTAFPAAVHHTITLGSAELRQLLATTTIDIVHVATYVCPRTGDVYFTEVDPETGASQSDEPDVMAADEFASLLKRAQSRLVVVGSCESLVLAATLLEVTNVVATRDLVSPRMMAQWITVFYGALATKRVSEAFDLAVAASGAKMRLFPKATVKTGDVGSPGLESARLRAEPRVRARTRKGAVISISGDPVANR